MTEMQKLLERVLAAKAALRIANRAKSWPEKVADIERSREVGRLARQAMQALKKSKQQLDPPQ